MENLGGNNKRKVWAREYKILLRLLTILECEFTQNPIAGHNLMKEMRWEGLSKKGPLETGFLGLGRWDREKTVVEAGKAKLEIRRKEP